MNRTNWIQPLGLVLVALMVCWLGLSGAETDAELGAVTESVEDVQQGLHALARTVAEEAVADRVLELPEDGRSYRTVVVLHDDWQRRRPERELVAWFAAQPELASLKAQTQFYLLTSDSATYEDFVAAAGGELPAVFVQDETGRALYKAAGDGLVSADRMAAELVTLFEKRPWLRLRPWLRPRPCPCPTPAPTPSPDPGPQPGPDIDVDVRIPDLRPPAERVDAAGGGDVWLVMAVVVVVAAVGAVAWNFRKAAAG